MKYTISLPGSPPDVSEVIVGEGLLEGLPGRVDEAVEGRSAYWIWDERVWTLWGEKVAAFGWPDLASGRVILFSGSERNKRLLAVEELARQLARRGADRTSALVAVGGGVTGDVTGFLASIYVRGIPHLQVPTTLLAQVDSSIGGKTGVDLPEGKNLLGTFYQPRSIWMDPQFFETLPEEEFRQGMAEVIKTAMIGDEVLWEYLEQKSDAVKRRESEALIRIVSSCCLLKAKVVEADEKEAGLRRILNLGHTVGHAIERLSDYRTPHGDAVSMGMIVSARLAVRFGAFPEDDLMRLERLCSIWGLPVRLPKAFTPEEILSALKTDKKWIGGTLHFIVPVRIGEVRDCQDLRMGELREVLASVRE